MTDAGADARANYLLKWSAIAGFADEGFRTYDLWGLATGGIRQFKEGFGGEEVAYVGARDLALRARPGRPSPHRHSRPTGSRSALGSGSAGTAAGPGSRGRLTRSSQVQAAAAPIMTRPMVHTPGR